MNYTLPQEDGLCTTTKHILPRLVENIKSSNMPRRVVGLLLTMDELLVLASDDSQFPVGTVACIGDMNEWEDFLQPVELSNS